MVNWRRDAGQRGVRHFVDLGFSMTAVTMAFLNGVVMTTYIGLLRGVNVGGHNKVAMADLCRLLTRLGMHGARSLLQSGNLVFRSNVRTTAELERLLKDAAAKRLGLETDFFVRTAKEWNALIAANPFPDEAADDPSHLLVVFLKDAPDRKDVSALQKAIPGRERVGAKGRQLYVVYPDGIGRSRLTAAMFGRHLGPSGTARNWNTVLKLGALADVS